MRAKHLLFLSILLVAFFFIGCEDENTEPDKASSDLQYVGSWSGTTS